MKNVIEFLMFNSPTLFICSIGFYYAMPENPEVQVFIFAWGLMVLLRFIGKKDDFISSMKNTIVFIVVWTLYLLYDIYIN